MARLVKRVVIVAILLYVLSVFVDFNSPQFDPYKEHLSSSLSSIAEGKYYKEYIQPANEKIQPVISEIKVQYLDRYKENLELQAKKVYDVHLARHVETLQGKITNSPVYDKFVAQNIPKVHRFVILLSKHINAFYKVASSKAALAYSAAEGEFPKVVALFHYTKERAAAFYTNQLSPFLITSWNSIKHYSSKYYVTISANASSFYRNRVVPIYQEHADPKVKEFYENFIRGHHENVSVFANKYYKVLKLDVIVSYGKVLYREIYLFVVSKVSADGGSSDTEREAETTTAESLEVKPTEFDSTDTPRSIDLTVDSSTTESIELEDEISTFIPSETEKLQQPLVTSEIKDSEKQALEVDTPDSANARDDEISTEGIENTEVTLTLLDEILHWKEFVELTVDSIFENYEKSVSDFAKKYIEDAKPTITASLQNVSKVATQQYIVLNRAIYNINSTTIKLENGQEAELDKEGKIIDHKVTRQEFRELLADGRELLDDTANLVNTQLKSLVSEVEDRLESERKLFVDILEEFAEVSVDEFSKKMMYSTYNNKFGQIANEKALNTEDDENFQDWKTYVKIKNFLIDKREELINKKPELVELKALLKEIHYTLKTLDHDRTSYFAILRAKANIQFQAREAKEQEQEQEQDTTGEVTQIVNEEKVAIDEHAAHDEDHETRNIEEEKDEQQPHQEEEEEAEEEEEEEQEEEEDDDDEGQQEEDDYDSDEEDEEEEETQTLTSVLYITVTLSNSNSETLTPSVKQEPTTVVNELETATSDQEEEVAADTTTEIDDA